MDQIWLRRIMRELSTSRSRTALTVISIAVGLFAVSLTFRTQAILGQTILATYQQADPAAIIVQLLPADPQLADSLRTIPGVAAVEGVQHLSTRALIGSTWRALALNAVDDLSAMQVNRLAPAAGEWPGPMRSMLIERSFVGEKTVQIGQDLLIELEDGRQRSLPVVGSTRDLTVISGRLGNPVYQGYISFDTAERLTGSRVVNEFQIALTPDQQTAAQRSAVADRVRARLEAAGCTIVYIRVRDPSTPDTYALLNAVFQLLTVLGILSLALSGALITNTLSSMLSRHVPQIGIMKAIGARSWTIFGSYFFLVLVVSLIAFAIAVPLAALCAWLLANQLGWLLNYDIQDASISANVILIELAAGLGVPLLASAYPIAHAARVTVREALTEGRGGSVSGSGQFLALPGIPLAVLYAARSMFRRKARLLFTLAALACGGAIEMAVISTQASLDATLTQVAAYWQQDLIVSLNQPAPADPIVAEALTVAGVRRVELQPATMAVRQHSDGRDSELRYALFGVVPESTLIKPTLLAGRWLEPGDSNAIVVNIHMLKYEPDLALGRQLTLKVGTRTTTWQIVGVVTDHMLIYGDVTLSQGVGYLTTDSFMRGVYGSLQTNRMIVTTDQQTPERRSEVGRAIEAQFAEQGIQALVQTQSDIRTQIGGFVSLIVVLLLVMALCFIAIGVLSLVGALSLNVLERTKEVGVLRAIGASHRSIALVVVVEGICVGLISWVPATILAIPLSKVLSDTLGWSMLNWPLVYTFPISAPLIWALTIGVISAMASYIPARRAAQINVRAALEYL